MNSLSPTLNSTMGDFYDEICFSDNKIIELKLTLFYNQIQLQTFHPSYYAVLVTNFSSIIVGYGDNILSRISPYQKLSRLRGENLAPLFCKCLS
jgi:hypothetical protein